MNFSFMQKSKNLRFRTRSVLFWNYSHCKTYSSGRVKARRILKRKMKLYTIAGIFSLLLFFLPGNFGLSDIFDESVYLNFDFCIHSNNKHFNNLSGNNLKF